MQRPSEINPGVSSDLEMVLTKALVADPTHRPDDLNALAQAFYQINNTASVAPPPADVGHLDHDEDFDIDTSVLCPTCRGVVACYRSCIAKPFIGHRLRWQGQCSLEMLRYLTGALELRRGTPNLGPARISGFLDALSVEQVFDAFGVRLNQDKIGGARFTMNWRFTDIAEDHVLGVSRRTMFHSPGRVDPDDRACAGRCGG